MRGGSPDACAPPRSAVASSIIVEPPSSPSEGKPDAPAEPFRKRPSETEGPSPPRRGSDAAVPAGRFASWKTNRTAPMRNSISDEVTGTGWFAPRRWPCTVVPLVLPRS
ncbi:MAG: hypothetical protein R3A52_13190 [Polyangiales bacterium]